MKPIIMAVVAVSLSAAFAETYHWTGGAGDSGGVYQWNNSANWDQGTRGSGTHAVPDAGATVVFGAMAGKTSADAVTIDLTDMELAGHLRIEDADAPSYRFGAENSLTKQDNSSPSNFKLANSKDSRHPTTVVIKPEVQSDQTISVFWHPSEETGETKTYSVYFSLSNASEQATLVLEKISRYTSSSVHAGAKICLYGAGDFSVGQPLYTSGTLPCLNVYSTGTVNWTASSFYGDSQFYGPFDLVLAEGAKFGMKNGTRPFSGYSYFNEDVTVTGPGKIWAFDQLNQAPTKYVGGDPSRGSYLRVAVGKKVVSTADIGGVTSPPQYLPLIATGNGGLDDWGFYQDGTNGLPLAIHLYAKARFGAKKIGRNGCSSEETSIGCGGEVVFMHYWTGGGSAGAATLIDSDTYSCDAVLAYTGDADETIDRGFLITNSCADAVVPVTDQTQLDRVKYAKATLRTEGRGALTLDADSYVRVIQDGARFTFDAATAPITFNGTFPSGTELAVKGAQPVTIGSEARLPANLKATLAGGVLLLNGVMGFEVESGDNTVIVSGARTLSALPDMPVGATVSFDLPTESDTLTVSGATSATDVPASIRVNGEPARFLDNGQLVEWNSHWRTATDGLWSDAAKWDAGVPPADFGAIVTATGADYAVGITATPSEMPRLVRVGQADGEHTATLSVRADLSAKPTTYEIRDNGVLEVGTDGRIDLGGGAAITTEGGADVRIVSGGFVEKPKDYTVSSGSWLVKDAGCFQYGDGNEKGSILRLQPAPMEKSVEFCFDTSEGKCQGASDFYQGRLYVGNCAGGSASLTFRGWGNEKQDKYSFFVTSRNPYGISAGYVRGFGGMSVTNGYLVVGNYGLGVGVADTNQDLPLAATGVVDQVDSYVNITGSGAPSSASLCGLIIGGADNFKQTVPFDQVRNKGTYNLTSGTLETRGYMIIGSGSSEGTFRQTGGTLKQTASLTSSVYTNHLYRTNPDPARARKFDYPTLIGFQGGKGLYEITGGTATISKSVFVASCFSDDDIPWGINDKGQELRPSDSSFPYGQTTGTEGCLRVKGGAVSIPDDCTVGKGGRGTIEMVGTNGTLSVGRLVATNGVKSVLRFICDRENPAAGVSPITVADKAMLDGTTLEVELGENYSGRARVRLINAPPVEGGFGRVTVTGKSAESAKVVKDELGVCLRIRRGFVMVVR